MNRMLRVSTLCAVLLATCAGDAVARSTQAAGDHTRSLQAAVRLAHAALLDHHAGRPSQWPMAYAVQTVPTGADAITAKRVVRSSLVGTWFLVAPGEPPEADFYALQTFHADGTFTETSSILAQLVEGPGHGIWAGIPGSGITRFDLFAFDEDHAAVGRIRVNLRITLVGANDFQADGVVDILPFDAEPILAVGGGPITGSRLLLTSP